MADDLYLEMRHQENLQELAAWRFLLKYKKYSSNAIFFTALVQNFVLVLRYSADGAMDPDPLMQHYYSFLHVVQVVMGCGQVIASLVILALYSMQNSPLQQRRCWADYSELSYEELLEEASEGSLLFKLKFILLSIYFFSTDGMLFFCFMCLATAILGITVSPFWFAFHLLDITTKSKDLQNVFKAVTQNGRSILATALFGVIIVYIYAIIGYIYLSDSFAVGDYPDDDIPLCTNLPVCWVGALNEGLRGGDVGAFMDPRDPQDPYFFLQVAYQLSFWAIVITILLNVIFGIIIDTFGELRGDNLAKKEHMENTCFISGVDRFTLDTKGRGFEKHIKEDQNMWNYLYLVVHLKEKDPTEYNGWEQWVADKLQAGDTSFIPVNTAISLSEYQERQEAESREAAARMLDIQQSAKTAAEAALKMQVAVERVERQLSGEGSAMAAVLERLDGVRELIERNT
jgi:hypothetical protein